jgi:hypothetical protein
MPMRGFYRQWVEEQLTTDRQWRDYAFEALRIIQAGDPAILVRFEDGTRQRISFWDVYCQTHWRNSRSFIESLMTALAWQSILRNDWIYVVYQVREKPRPDEDVAGNNDILQDMIRRYPKIFRGAEFWGGTQGEDGRISFHRTAIRDFRGYASNDRQGAIEFAHIPRPVEGKETSFPLEVGYCLPDQFETHIMDEGCIARFPYGYDLIIFIEDIRDHVARMERYWTEVFGELDLTSEGVKSVEADVLGQLTLW